MRLGKEGHIDLANFVCCVYFVYNGNVGDFHNLTEEERQVGVGNRGGVHLVAVGCGGDCEVGEIVFGGVEVGHRQATVVFGCGHGAFRYLNGICSGVGNVELSGFFDSVGAGTVGIEGVGGNVYVTGRVGVRDGGGCGCRTATSQKSCKHLDFFGVVDGSRSSAATAGYESQAHREKQECASQKFYNFFHDNFHLSISQSF